jgi:FkbM family methyltransferase
LCRLPGASGVDRSSQLKIDCFNSFEVAYRQGTADESVLKHSFDHDIFFSGVPEYQPSEKDVIIDVGAHIGTFAVWAASKVPRGAVHAIEACQDTYNFLRINAALNRMGNLSTHHLALSDRQGTSTLYYDTGNWGHSVVRRQSNRSETVECCTLEEFFRVAGITKCSKIQL